MLQQAWDPELDIDGYINAVIALIGRFTGLAGTGSGEEAAEARRLPGCLSTAPRGRPGTAER